MTKQEAIGKIEYIIDNGQDYGYWTDAQKKALNMAIKALEQEPSCRNPRQVDLISRQDAIETIEKESQVDGAYGYMDTKSIVDLLNNLPSAEPNPFCALADRECPFQGKEFAWCLTCPHISEEDRALVKKVASEPKGSDEE